MSIDGCSCYLDLRSVIEKKVIGSVDPRKVIGSVDPRKVIGSVDPRKVIGSVDPSYIGIIYIRMGQQGLIRWKVFGPWGEVLAAVERLKED